MCVLLRLLVCKTNNLHAYAILVKPIFINIAVRGSLLVEEMKAIPYFNNFMPLSQCNIASYLLFFHIWAGVTQQKFLKLAKCSVFIL